MTTYRERRERRVERLEEWAGKREAKATSAEEAASAKASMIPFGQPMMPDHHSYRSDRSTRDGIRRGFDKAYEHSQKASGMQSKAANIRSQLDRAIYDDDPDAVEQLQKRIAELEATRQRIKAFNASCRKGLPDESLLDEGQRQKLASVRQHSPYSIGKRGEFPSYALTNLSGNINRLKKRLEKLGG